MPTPPAAFTDDLSLRVARNETLGGLVNYLLESEQAGTPWPVCLTVLTERFALSFDDARLAVDRVAGGRVRARTSNPLNEPDSTKDPVAWIAYHRARGDLYVPVARTSGAWRELLTDASTGDASSARRRMDTALFRLAVRADERSAASFWRDAYDAVGETKGTCDVLTALRMLEIGRATMASSCSPAIKARVSLQVATALSTTTEALVTEIGSERCAREGSQTWVDGVALAAAAREVAAFFAELGDADLERRAYDLQGRTVTRLMGQCHARVGSAMIDSARCALRHGDRTAAGGTCMAVVGDFARIVDEWEGDNAVPYDEHRIALQHLMTAIDLLASVGTADATAVSLRDRCEAVLARQA